MEMEYKDPSKRGRWIVVIGIVLALAAGGAAFFLINQAQQQAGQAGLQKVAVVVAARPIQARKSRSRPRTSRSARSRSTRRTPRASSARRTRSSVTSSPWQSSRARWSRPTCLPPTKAAAFRSSSPARPSPPTRRRGAPSRSDGSRQPRRRRPDRSGHVGRRPHQCDGPRPAGPPDEPASTTRTSRPRSRTRTC